MKPFRLLNHTADLGMVVYGATREALFENAARAFFHIVADLRKVRCRTERRVEVSAGSLERLMVDWLNELLYLQEVENLLFREVKVEFMAEDRLRAVVRGEPYQEGVHVIKTAVKAVTHHQIVVQRENGHWKAQIILDL